MDPLNPYGGASLASWIVLLWNWLDGERIHRLQSRLLKPHAIRRHESERFDSSKRFEPKRWIQSLDDLRFATDPLEAAARGLVRLSLAEQNNRSSTAPVIVELDESGGSHRLTRRNDLFATAFNGKPPKRNDGIEALAPGLRVTKTELGGVSLVGPNPADDVAAAELRLARASLQPVARYLGQRRRGEQAEFSVHLATLGIANPKEFEELPDQIGLKTYPERACVQKLRSVNDEMT